MPIPNEDHLRYQADCALDPVEQEIDDPVACVDCGDIYDREDFNIHRSADGEYRCIWCEEESENWDAATDF